MHEGKLRCSLITMLMIATISNGDQSTQKYLENAVKNLQNLRQLQTRQTIQSPVKSRIIHRRSQHYADGVPPLSLTKGELTALYEQAVAKGDTIKLDTGEQEYVNAVVHHLDDEHHPSYSAKDHEEVNELSLHDGPNSEDAGYYYYYYPIKSFLDQMTSQPSEEHIASYHKPSYHHHKEEKLPYTYHSHHHEHNVTIQTADHHKKDAKPMEPIFMAISGFIGMAVMFVLSMVVLPKLGIKPKIINEIKKKEKLDDFARFAINAIEGNCAERFACELTKTARSFDMEDNRFYKLLKRVAPGTFGRYINNSGKYTGKQLQCTAIPCTRRKPNHSNNKNMNNQNRNHKNNHNNNNNNNRKKNQSNLNQKNNNKKNNNGNKQFNKMYQSH